MIAVAKHVASKGRVLPGMFFFLFRNLDKISFASELQIGGLFPILLAEKRADLHQKKNEHI